MKSILLILISAFSLINVSGQSPYYPNELMQFRLISHPKLHNFFPGVTPQEAVESRFGSMCEADFCELDENWLVRFDFFAKNERRLPKDPKFPRSVPIKKYEGRLRAITLKPRQKISFAGIRFDKQFSHGRGTVVGIGVYYKTIVHSDDWGLTYEISNEAKHDLLCIIYGLKPTEDQNAFENW
jgi:hypothetical protein